MMLLLPVLIGFLIHFLEERIDNPDVYTKDNYRSRLISLLMIFALCTLFSFLCEWLS